VTKHFGIPVTSPARTFFDNTNRLDDLALAPWSVTCAALGTCRSPTWPSSYTATHRGAPRTASASRSRTPSALVVELDGYEFHGGRGRVGERAVVRRAL
jgi:hypothetical protein